MVQNVIHGREYVPTYQDLYPMILLIGLQGLAAASLGLEGALRVSSEVIGI